MDTFEPRHDFYPGRGRWLQEPMSAGVWLQIQRAEAIVLTRLRAKPEYRTLLIRELERRV